MPGEVVQNFRRGRWKREVGWHTLERLPIALSTRRAFASPKGARFVFFGVNYSLGWSFLPGNAGHAC
jgi:hypothetical protein